MATTPFLPLQLGSAEAAPVGALVGCARETLDTILTSAASRLAEYAAATGRADTSATVHQAFAVLRRDFVAPLLSTPLRDQEFLSPVQMRRVSGLRAALEGGRGQGGGVATIIRAITRLTVFTNTGAGTAEEYRRGRDTMALFVLGVSMAFAGAAGDLQSDLEALYEEYAAEVTPESVSETLRMRGLDRDDYWRRVDGIERIDLRRDGGRILPIPEDERGSCFYASVAASLEAAGRKGWDSELVRQYLTVWMREHGHTHRFEMGLTIAEMLVTEDNPSIRTMEGYIGLILSNEGFFGGHPELLATTQAFDADVYVYERVAGEPQVLRRLGIGRSVLGQCVEKDVALHLVFRTPVGSAHVHLNSAAHWDVYLPPVQPRTASPRPVPMPPVPPPARAPPGPAAGPFHFSLALPPAPPPFAPGLFSFGPSTTPPPPSLAEQQRATLAEAAERRGAKATAKKPARRR